MIPSLEAINTHWLASVLGLDAAQISGFETQAVSSNDATGKWRLKLQYAAAVPPEKAPQLFLKISANSHEARFYQIAQRLTAAHLPIVPCYSVGITEKQAYILLQDMSATHEARPPSQMPPLATDCEAIIDALADLHAYWWNHPQLTEYFGNPPSAEQIRQNAHDNTARYHAYADFLADRLPAQRRAIYERVNAHLADLLVERFQRGKLTLTFEDVHVGNFLYPKSAGERLYFIDWEQWGINLAMNDLAYMMALFWSSERRQRLEIPYLQRYHARILAQKVDYSWAELWYDYRLSVLQHLYNPVWQYTHNGFVEVWWNHYERIFNAYADLACDELFKSKG